MQIDFHGLETFLAVVRHGSVSAAAGELRRTQSAISQRLRQFEDALGARLFNRGRGRSEVALTIAGETLLPLALRWELLSDELQSVPLTRQHVISMGATPMISDHLLARILERLPAISSRTTIRIVSAGSAELYARLERREFDFAYVSHAQRMPGVAVRLAATEGYRVATRMTGLRKNRALSIANLDPHLQVHIDYGPDFRSWFTTVMGQAVRHNISVNDVRTSVHFLGNPGHWCIVPDSVAVAFGERHGIPSYAISGLSVQRNIFQAYLEEMTPASAAGKGEFDALFATAIQTERAFPGRDRKLARNS